MEQKEMKEYFAEYTANIKRRQADGEADLTLLAFNKWAKKGKDKDGKEIPVPGITGETKAESSTRIAISRMGKFITVMERLENMESPNYHFTPEQVDKMTETITKRYNKIIEILAVKKNAPVTGEKTTKVDKKFVF